MDTQVANSLDTFIDALLQEAYPNTPLPGDQKSSMKGEIKGRLISFINTDLVNALPKEKMEELDTLIENGESQEKINAFIAANVPNQESLVAASLINFRNMYLGR